MSLICFSVCPYPTRTDRNKAKGASFIPVEAADAWATGMTMRIEALLRHWSQSVNKRRSWVPKEFMRSKEDDEGEEDNGNVEDGAAVRGSCDGNEKDEADEKRKQNQAADQQLEGGMGTSSSSNRTIKTKTEKEKATQLHRDATKGKTERGKSQGNKKNPKKMRVSNKDNAQTSDDYKFYCYAARPSIVLDRSIADEMSGRLPMELDGTPFATPRSSSSAGAGAEQDQSRGEAEAEQEQGSKQSRTRAAATDADKDVG
jgi:hypothetical protein